MSVLPRWDFSRQTTVKYGGVMMQNMRTTDGAVVIGLPVQAATRVRGFDLYVLDVPTMDQRHGIGERTLRLLRKTFGAPITVYDPLPDSMGFWRKMKKRGLVDALRYSDEVPA